MTVMGQKGPKAMDDIEGPWGAPRPPAPPKRRMPPGVWIWLALLAAVAAVFLLLMYLFPSRHSDMEWTQAVRLFAVLAVITSALARGRRFRLGASARAIAGWVAILALIVVGYVFRDDLGAAATKVRSALIPGYAVADSPRSMVIGRSDNGSFYVMGEVNGAPVRFLIDTGATDIVLSPDDAEHAGLSPGSMTFSRPSETANGVGYGAPVTVKSLTVGQIRLTDVPVFINQNPMSASLLGMPFLRRFESVEVRGDQLFLRRGR